MRNLAALIQALTLLGQLAVSLSDRRWQRAQVTDAAPDVPTPNVRELVLRHAVSEAAVWLYVADCHWIAQGDSLATHRLNTLQTAAGALMAYQLEQQQVQG